MTRSAGNTVTAGAGATVSLYLPPQHLLEETTETDPAADWRAHAVAAGPSRVTIVVPAGTVIELTAAGVLAAGCVLGGGSRSATLLELPTGLLFQPSAVTGPTRAVHRAGPVTSPDRGSGLWTTQLRSAAAPEPAEQLELRALGSIGVGSGFPASLTPFDRTRIAELGQEVPARSGPITLSALGATFSVRGDWDGFSWSTGLCWAATTRSTSSRTSCCTPSVTARW